MYTQMVCILQAYQYYLCPINAYHGDMNVGVCVYQALPLLIGPVDEATHIYLVCLLLQTPMEEGDAAVLRCRLIYTDL